MNEVWRPPPARTGSEPPRLLTLAIDRAAAAAAEAEACEKLHYEVVIGVVSQVSAGMHRRDVEEHLPQLVAVRVRRAIAQALVKGDLIGRESDVLQVPAVASSPTDEDRSIADGTATYADASTTEILIAADQTIGYLVS